MQPLGQPIDYTIRNIPDPSKAVEEGIKFANDWKDRSAAELKAKQAAEAQAVFQAKLRRLADNPTSEAVARMSLEYPELSEQFKRSYDMLSPGEQQGRLSAAMPVYAALQSGQIDIATKLLDEQAEAARNSGKSAEAKAAEDTAKAIRINPTAHKLASGMFLARVLGPEKFKENFAGIQGEGRAEGLAPSLLSISESEAKIKANEAKGIMPPKFIETETGIMQWDSTEGKLVPSGYKPVKKAGVNISMGTPQFAVEESTGQQVIYQPSASGEIKIIRGLRPVTEQTKESGKEAAKFEKLSNVIDIARKTMKDASGSLLGAGAASVARAAGVSTATSKANAKLKALQAAMMMNMPRMEGPQSDKDVELYREQAGRIGDPTAPIDDRMAALDVLGELMDRYKTGKPSAGPKPATSVDDLLKALGHGSK